MVAWETSVYALIDPRTDETFYYGMTNSTMQQRLQGHMTGARKLGRGELVKAPTAARILSIMNDGGMPVIREVGTASSRKEAEQLETTMIKRGRELGYPLVNRFDSRSEAGRTGGLAKGRNYRERKAKV